MIGLYFLGIAMGILTAVISRKTMFHGEAVPFVMELPNYRLPGAKNVLRLMWDKAKDFLQRAFTVIFMASLVIWFLQTFDLHLAMVSDSQNSILAAVAGLIAPVFAPLGFGDWRICTSLIVWIYGKGKRCFYTFSIVWKYKDIVGSTLAAVSSISSCILSSVHTVYRSNLFH